MKQFIFNYFTAILLLTITVRITGQNNLPRYWISFTDKENTPYTIDRPEAFLSARAIERRTRQNIPVTTEDLPVDPEYIDSLSNLGLQIINVSKWFNGVLAATDDTMLIHSLSNLDFISAPALLVRPSISGNKGLSEISMLKNECSSDLVPYGYSSSQITMLHGEYLHTQGFEGQGMLIAILDAGFTNANQVSSLSHIWQDDRIVAEKDFVKDEYTLYNSHPHGTLVFSIIAGIHEGVLYGSATQAKFALVRTEEGDHEYIVEEYNWVCGAEFADSLGADIINSSLGYSLFDNPLQDHSYSDMDGHTTPVSVAAQNAASKGMVVVSSAGNSGSNSWHYITAPADADSILTIGAVDSLGIITSFSSRGPSYDRRTKPDVCSQGLYTVCQYPTEEFIYCAGTSCSAPIISGMAACLWQANPSVTSYEIVETFRKAGSQYFNPDSLCGYGIPDLLKADYILGGGISEPANSLISFSLFPNPVRNDFYLVISRPSETNNQTVTITIFDTMGRFIRQVKKRITGKHFALNFDHFEDLSTGFYMVQVIISGRTYSIPFMKI